jgi:Flp pilus assembly protein TadB
MEKDCKGRDTSLVVEVQPGLRGHWDGISHKSKDKRDSKVLTRLRITSGERISCVAFHAITDRAVVVDATLCVLAASVGTGVNAFLVCACFVVRALRADDTLWSTTRWTSNISW